MICINQINQTSPTLIAILLTNIYNNNFRWSAIDLHCPVNIQNLQIMQDGPACNCVYFNPLLCPVMEIACGQYGDVIPKLVVAVQNDSCAKFQDACMSEKKQINCDKLVKEHDVMDAKHLLQDGVNIDSALSSGYNELFIVQKVEHAVDTNEVDNPFSSPWKPVNYTFNSDKIIASSKPVSLLTDFSSMCNFDAAVTVGLCLLYC